MNNEISRNPIINLKPFLKQKIEIYLKGNYIIQGTLKLYDKYSNLILENAKMIKNNTEDDLNIIYIKGSNVN